MYWRSGEIWTLIKRFSTLSFLVQSTHHYATNLQFVVPTGLEPVTRWLWVSCSDQLSYRTRCQSCIPLNWLVTNLFYAIITDDLTANMWDPRFITFFVVISLANGSRTLVLVCMIPASFATSTGQYLSNPVTHPYLTIFCSSPPEVQELHLTE